MGKKPRKKKLMPKRKMARKLRMAMMLKIWLKMKPILRRLMKKLRQMRTPRRRLKMKVRLNPQLLVQEVDVEEVQELLGGHVGAEVVHLKNVNIQPPARP